MTGNTAIDSTTNLVKEKINELNAVKAEAVKVIRDNFKDIFMDFFNKYPDVAEASWLQYTPYFNDGDACYFGVHDLAFITKGDMDADGNPMNEDYYYGEIPRGFHYQYTPNGHRRVNGFTQEEIDAGYTLEMLDDFQKLRESFSSIPEEIFLELFGDHARVVVTREGVSVEEYDHD